MSGFGFLLIQGCCVSSFCGGGTAPAGECRRTGALFVRGEMARYREWMMWAVSVLLGIASTRPVMGVFFATSRLTHLEPQQFFGIAFWIGFGVT